MIYSEFLLMELFNLKYTLESGQPLTFFGTIFDDGNKVAYPYKSSVIFVEEEKGALRYSYLGEEKFEGISKEVERRFGLHDNLKEIYKRINTDKFIGSAIKRYAGLRVTQNDPWEATLCFIISQFNNIKRIHKIVTNIIAKFGEKTPVSSINAFPTPEAIARASESDIKACGAGFRAKYIKEAAELCSSSLNLNSLYKKNYEEAKEVLLEIPGIGDKVADCILLMGYKKLESFPVDTWIKRVIENRYLKKRASIEEIHAFAKERWGAYAGYAQQYLYHMSRINKEAKDE